MLAKATSCASKLDTPLNPTPSRQIKLTRNGIILEVLTEDEAERRLLSQKNLVAIRSKRKSRRLKELRVSGGDLMRPLWQGAAGNEFKEHLGDSGLWCYSLTGVHA